MFCSGLRLGHSCFRPDGGPGGLADVLHVVIRVLPPVVRVIPTLMIDPNVATVEQVQSG